MRAVLRLPGEFCWRDRTAEVNLLLGKWLRRDKYAVEFPGLSGRLDMNE